MLEEDNAKILQDIPSVNSPYNLALTKAQRRTEQRPIARKSESREQSLSDYTFCQEYSSGKEEVMVENKLLFIFCNSSE